MKLPMTLMALLTLGTTFACGPLPEVDTAAFDEIRTGSRAGESGAGGAAPATDEVTTAGEEGKPPPPPPPPPQPLPSESVNFGYTRLHSESASETNDDDNDVATTGEAGTAPPAEGGVTLGHSETPAGATPETTDEPTADGEADADTTRDDGGEEDQTTETTYGPVITVKPKG